MPNKRNLRPLSKHHNERIELIDELLHKFGHIRSRKDLLQMINSRIAEPVSQETLDKDLNDLRVLLSRYYLETGKLVTLDYKQSTGYHYSNRSFRLFKNSVSEDDKQLLFLANSLFSVFEGTPMHENFKNVIEKILADSLTGNRHLMNLPENVVQIEQGHSLKSTQWLANLLTAIYEKDTLEIMYKGKLRDMCPYVIRQYKGRWYMVAWDYSSTRKEKTNVFALDKIEEIKGFSGRPYYVDPSFNAQHYFRYSIGIWHHHHQNPVKVVIEVLDNSLFESIVNNPIHCTQCILDDNDSNKLCISIEVYDSPELYNLLLGFGKDVKVLSPEFVISAMQKTAADILLNYNNPSI